MHISLGIRMQMVMPMFRGPPEDAFLCAALGEEREEELKYPASRVGSVREVPMIPSADREHARPIENHANCNRLPCNARPDRRDAPYVDQ
jgi:hypothetical protein